jgi:hypothetical protein
MMDRQPRTGMNQEECLACHKAVGLVGKSSYASTLKHHAVTRNEKQQISTNSFGYFRKCPADTTPCLVLSAVCAC